MCGFLEIALLLCSLVIEIRSTIPGSSIIADLDWDQKLLRDLRRISDPVTPPLLDGQTEKDLRINITVTEIKTFEVDLDENDPFVELDLGLRIEWSAPAFRWPPEAYGNITETIISHQATYIRSNLNVKGDDRISVDHTGKISWPVDVNQFLDCVVSTWFPSVRLRCEQKLTFEDSSEDLLEFGCELEPVFISDILSIEWKLRRFTCAENAEDNSKLLIFEVQRVADVRAYEIVLVLALSFMHGFVPSELPERAVLAGASFVSVLVFLLSPMCQSDPWWLAFSGLWSRLLCAHVLLTVFRLAPLKLSGTPKKVASSFGRNFLMKMPTAVQETLISISNVWEGFEKVLITVYAPVQSEDSANARSDTRLRLSFMCYHALELCILFTL